MIHTIWIQHPASGSEALTHLSGSRSSRSSRSMSTSEIRSEAAESLGPRRGDDDGRTPNGKVLGVFNEELIFHGEKNLHPQSMGNS